MKHLSNFLPIFIVLALLGLLGWGVYWAFSFFGKQYAELGSSWAAGLTIMSVVLILCSFIIAWPNHKLANRSALPVHPEKGRAYELFADLWLGPDSLTGNLRGKKMAQRYWELDRQLSLWVSDEVLEAYLLFVKICEDPESLDNELTVKAEKLLLVMRRDLGTTNAAFLPVDLLQLLSLSEASGSGPDDVRKKRFG